MLNSFYLKRILCSILLTSMVFIGACSDDDSGNNNNNNNNNNSNLPDAVFKIDVSGSETLNVEFTLPGNIFGDFGVNGAFTNNILIMNASPLPATSWSVALVAQNIQKLEEGTFTLNAQEMSFANSSQTKTYFLSAGTLKITKANLSTKVGNTEEWFIDGTITGTLFDASPNASVPTGQIDVSITFSNINIKAQ